MHEHVLHRPVDAECDCCAVVQRFTFKAISDHVICKGCLRHQGESAARLRQRDSDHRDLWRSELAIAQEDLADARQANADKQEAHREELSALSHENASLRQSVRDGLSGTSPANVQQIMRDQAVTEAQEQRDASYRALDRAYGSVWAVHELHHRKSIGGNDCSCGHRATACKILVALADTSDAFNRWEQAQIRRARDRKPHGLPYQHPDYTDSGRW